MMNTLSIVEVYCADLIAAVTVMTEPVIMRVENDKVRIKVDGLDKFLLDQANIWFRVLETIEPPKPEPVEEFRPEF